MTSLHGYYQRLRPTSQGNTLPATRKSPLRLRDWHDNQVLLKSYTENLQTVTDGGTDDADEDACCDAIDESQAMTPRSVFVLSVQSCARDCPAVMVSVVNSCLAAIAARLLWIPWCPACQENKEAQKTHMETRGTI